MVLPISGSRTGLSSVWSRGQRPASSGYSSEQRGQIFMAGIAILAGTSAPTKRESLGSEGRTAAHAYGLDAALAGPGHEEIRAGPGQVGVVVGVRRTDAGDATDRVTGSVAATQDERLAVVAETSGEPIGERRRDRIPRRRER